MQNSEPLVPLGIAIIALTFGLIVIPYLRGKCDVLTAWNLFLLGGVMFTGVGCLEVAYGVFHWPELQWFQPSKQDVSKFMLGTVCFYATLLFSYYKLKWPRRVAAVFFNKWPPQSTGSLYFFLGLFLCLMLMAFLFKNVPIANALFGNVSHKAAVFATVFSFSFWYRNKVNVAALGLFLGIFGYALLFAMVTFVGRRLLLSVAITPLICMYWLKWRYRSAKFNLVWLGFAAFLALGVAAFYSTIRHTNVMSSTHERSFSSIVQDIKGTSLDKAIAQVSIDWMHYVAQYTTHYSLLTIHLIDGGQAEVEPLNTLAFLATYPVPRMLFPGKPAAYGARIVTDVLRLPYATNWGLGIVGHGYQEGGIPVIMLYAVLIVIMIRVLDDALVRQPSNVYLLGILCTASPHFVSLMRGDTCNMTAEICESFFFAWGLSLLGRFLIGTAPTTNEAPSTHNGPPQLCGQFRHLGR